MTYKGGKGGSGVYQQIINQIPPHDVYISAFAGHDAVYCHIKPASSSIVIDIDAEVIEWWKGAPVIAMRGDAISLLPGLIARYVDMDQRVFVYADPPYLKFDIDGSPVRASARDVYTHELAHVDEHKLLLQYLLTAPCMVAVSGYWSLLYAHWLKEWRSISFNAVTRGGTVAREWVWMNYPYPMELHDYRYLGSNFREREKITRQKRRWLARLRRMPDLQRYALLDAIAEWKGAGDRVTGKVT